MIDCRMLIEKRKELWEASKNIEDDREYRELVASRLISGDGDNLREEIDKNPEILIELFFVIVSKQQEVVPFFLNEVQVKFLNRLNSDLQLFEKGELHHLNYLILKGRQQGFTSFITAYQLACTLIKKNFSGFTVTDTGDNTNTVFEDKAKYPYSQLPESIKPTEKYNTRKEMIFEALNSKWRVASAGNKEIGRSKTINFFHGSESAFWKSIQSIMGALGQALTKNCIKILESTANGFNEYRQLWVDGENKDNNWQPLFFAWWETSEYRLDFENLNAKNDFIEQVTRPKTQIDKKLKWLLEEKSLDWEQIYWYFGKYKDLKELLAQEYPCTPEESFLASGNPIFDNAKVIARKDYLEKHYKEFAPKKGKFTYKYENERIIDSSIKFVEDINGWITIYEDVLPFYPYVIGGDTAEGGKDYCVGQILNNNTGKQVATFRARMDTDLFAKQMYCIGKYFNTALIGIESNFDLHPIKELERLRYPKQYMREAMDNLGGMIQNKAGFNTNRATKPVIIGDLVEIVREATHLINDPTTLGEMITFIDNEGRLEAVEGEHDDTVLALAIAYAIRKQQRTNITVEEEKVEALPFALRTDTRNYDDTYEDFF